MVTEPYLELQTSKLNNLGSLEKLKQRSTTFLLQFNPIRPFPILDNMANNDKTLKEGSPTSKIVNEVVVVDNQRLENKITELTSLVRQLAIGQHHNTPPVRVCGMCAFIEHPTNACPILQEIEPQRYQPPPPFKPQQSMQHVQQSSLEELVK
ncbi:hypothetical protein CR513_06786, partial [Mucuna pruriens]